MGRLEFSPRCSGSGRGRFEAGCGNSASERGCVGGPSRTRWAGRSAFEASFREVRIGTWVAWQRLAGAPGRHGGALKRVAGRSRWDDLASNGALWSVRSRRVRFEGATSRRNHPPSLVRSSNCPPSSASPFRRSPRRPTLELVSALTARASSCSHRARLAIEAHPRARPRNPRSLRAPAPSLASGEREPHRFFAP